MEHNVAIEPTDVSPLIGSRLIALSNQLALDFGAADFMQDSEGTLQFLEINSQPMFAAFDRVIDGKLSDAIIDHLLNSSIPERNSIWHLVVPLKGD
jgi:hypothetical protein